MPAGLDAPENATDRLSNIARRRMLALRGEPFLIADWLEALMVHLEVDAAELQRATPLPIDVNDGRAFVSLVFFTMRRMRFNRGNILTNAMLRPMASHEFLNVRTYVRCGDEIGIYFLAEWLPNRLSVLLGPRLFGLPYRLGRLKYRRGFHPGDSLAGEATDVQTHARLAYAGRIENVAGFSPCQPGSLNEWLMERYTAFTCRGQRRRFFRVWHRPWLQAPASVELTDPELLHTTWPWLSNSQITGANYSPGFCDVWMGRPRRFHGAAAEIAAKSPSW